MASGRGETTIPTRPPAPPTPDPPGRVGRASTCLPSVGCSFSPARRFAFAAGDLHVLPAAAGPFALLLVAIAALPLVAAGWWHRNRNKALVTGLLALPAAGYLLAQGEPGRAALVHELAEYFSFIALLGRPVRRVRRDRPPRRPRRPAADQPAVPGRRGHPRQPDRHHGREHGPHPPGIADQLPTQPDSAHSGLFHLHGQQHRRAPDPARRPAAVPRLPQGVSASSGRPGCGGVAARQRPGAGRLLRLGLGRLPAGDAGRHPAGGAALPPPAGAPGSAERPAVGA